MNSVSAPAAPPKKRCGPAPEERRERFLKELRHLDKRLQAPVSGSITSVSVLDRGRIFAPTSKPSMRDTWAMPDVVPFVCTTQVCGRLGQMHAALLESCLLRQVSRTETKEGLTLVVPLADVLNDLSVMYVYSGDGLALLLDDLCTARFRLSRFGKTWGADYKGTPAPDAVEGGFLTGWKQQAVSGTAKGKVGNKIMLHVTLAPALLALLRHDKAPTGHRERLAIVHLKDGRSRAAARWLLSQAANRQPGNGWEIDTVLTAVLGLRAPEQLKKDRLALRSEAAEIWERCGIELFRHPSGRKTANRIRLKKPAGWNAA